MLVTVRRELHLETSHLSGTLPEELSALSALQSLSLPQNNFTGTLPNAWTAMSWLTYLYISPAVPSLSSGLAGTLPSGIGAMASLQYDALLCTVCVYP